MVMTCKLRTVRIEFAGAACPVMARGSQGRDVHGKERDRKWWPKTLGKACEKTGWRRHARLKSDTGHRPGGARRAATDPFRREVEARTQVEFRGPVAGSCF